MEIRHLQRKMKGRISKIGSYAISSSTRDCISCTTFNILAPIYKRLSQNDQSIRESDNRAYWMGRNHRILDWLLYERSSIICLQVPSSTFHHQSPPPFWFSIMSSNVDDCDFQEFWVGNEELVRLYEKRLGDAGYLCYKLGRTNNRGDGKPILLDSGLVYYRLPT